MSDNEIGTGIMERLLTSSDTSIGKSFIMLGFGNARLVEKVKAKELVLWSISQSKGHPDEFTKGWSGCDPGQLYFVENTEPNAPKNNLLLGVERMSEAQCSSPSTPGGDLTADEPQYDWRTRHDSYLKYLYVENPPKLAWNGEEWITETNAPTTRATD